MIPKYTIEYGIPFRKNTGAGHLSTDDPVACEEFVQELLEGGYKINSIKHEGVDLPKVEFDKIIKTAAAMLSSKCICTSLGIKPDEERYRFGFTA